jgi:hypothetical protein
MNQPRLLKVYSKKKAREHKNICVMVTNARSIHTGKADVRSIITRKLFSIFTENTQA